MGRVFKPTYTVKGPDGERITKQSDAYHIEWTDSSGRTRHRKAGITESVAKDALRQAEAEVLAEKNGLPTRKAGEILVKELLADYLAALKQRVSDRHCEKTKRAIKALLVGIRAAFLKDIKPEAVEGYLARLSDGTRAGRTVNAPLVAIKALLNWAVSTRRIPYNPLACVKKVSEKAKARRRRPLSEIEISRLLTAAQEGPYRRAMRRYQNRPRKDGTFKVVTIPLPKQAALAAEGRGVALAYRLMIEAGLRLNETRCLKWADMDLAAGVLHLRSETTKNGKAESLPLSPGLLDALKARKAETKASDAAPVVKVSSRMLKNFNNDLVAAGIASLDAAGDVLKTDASGRTVDLHALRHTCGTRLINNGIDIKTVQAIMRHSTAALTLGIYVHKDKGRMADAVAAMPDLMPAALKNTLDAALKNGTDDRDGPPDDVGNGGRLPTRGQQEKADDSRNAKAATSLPECAIPTLNHRVVGSNPTGRIYINNHSLKGCNNAAPIFGRGVFVPWRLLGESGAPLAGFAARTRVWRVATCKNSSLGCVSYESSERLETLAAVSSIVGKPSQRFCYAIVRCLHHGGLERRASGRSGREQHLDWHRIQNRRDSGARGSRESRNPSTSTNPDRKPAHRILGGRQTSLDRI